jgi:hypothetical protein
MYQRVIILHCLIREFFGFELVLSSVFSSLLLYNISRILCVLSYISDDEVPEEFTWQNVNGKCYLTHSLNQHIPQCKVELVLIKFIISMLYTSIFLF